MGVALRNLSVIAMLLSLPMGGCVHGFRHPPPSLPTVSGGDRTSPMVNGVRDPGMADKASRVPPRKLASPKLHVPPAPSETVADEPSMVVPAVAQGNSAAGGSIIQTAGIFDKPAETVKQGVNKVADAITPTPHVIPADDPTLLSTKSKPTPELYLSMAKFYEESGKPAAAEQAYQQALRMAPKHLGAHLAYARFKERQGETREAIQWCQRAARLYPNEAAVYNDWGLICARHGIHGEALAAYRRAIELQPKRPLYRNNIAVLLVDMGQADQALTHLMAVYSEAEAHYKLGYLLQAKGEIHQAMWAFSQAAGLNPSMREARVWLQHLQAQQASMARANRRPSDGFESLPTPPQGQPLARDRSPDDATPGGPQLPPSDSALAPRLGARPLPPVTPPSPEAPVRRLPEADAEPSRPEGPVPWPRRLPPVSPERPIAFEEALWDVGPATRGLVWTVEQPVDAPLPTALPPSQLAR